MFVNIWSMFAVCLLIFAIMFPVAYVYFVIGDALVDYWYSESSNFDYNQPEGRPGKKSPNIMTQFLCFFFKYYIYSIVCYL